MQNYFTKKHVHIFMFLLMAAITMPPLASEPGKGFFLVDQICTVVGNEGPVLESEIRSLATEKGISFRMAFREKIHERALGVYAKKQLKYNVDEIEKAAGNHIKELIKKNNMSQKEFKNVLQQSPYYKSLSQYKKEIYYAIVRRQIKASIVDEISLDQKQIEEQAQKLRVEHDKSFDIAFITITSQKEEKQKAKTPDAALNRQFEKAKKIKKEIGLGVSLNDIKNRYDEDGEVSIVGPLEYNKGDLKEPFEKQIALSSSKKITEPFEHEGSVVLIVKVKRPMDKDFNEEVLEKAREKLYEERVNERLKEIARMVLKDLPVINNCNNNGN